jgi:hypothetical protein
VSAVDDRDVSDAGKRGCYFCGGQDPADFCEFYAGFCLFHKKTRAFLSNTVHIRGEYRDLKRYGVPVCDACATRARLWYHLPGILGWGLPALGCGLAAAVVAVTNAAGDQTPYLLGVLLLFAVLGGVLSLLGVWQLLRPGSSPAVTLAVLRRVKKDPKFRKKGDSFFGPEEYRVLFKAEDDKSLSAEELLARDRARGGGREGRRPKRKTAQEKKACPFCEATIPSYAQACPHCKKVFP